MWESVPASAGSRLPANPALRTNHSLNLNQNCKFSSLLTHQMHVSSVDRNVKGAVTLFPCCRRCWPQR